MKKILILTFWVSTFYATAQQQNLIQSTGSVGIGTTSPAYNLDVQGTTRLNGIVYFGINNWHRSNDGKTRLYFEENSHTYFGTANGYVWRNAADADLMSLSSAGNVVFNNNITINGKLNYGEGNSRTEYKDNASLKGDAGSSSGFFQTVNPINFPTGAASWWHLLDIRHSNNSNNYAMQFAGSFFDQKVYLRKVNNNPTQQWEQILTDKNIEGLLVKYNTSGNVGIGTTDPGAFKLAVNGSIKAKEVKVSSLNWADFVFANEYQLPPLSEVETFIKVNKHLPQIPSEKEVLEQGINLGEMNAKLLQKIEELTLYVIELKKENDTQSKEIKELISIIKK